MRMLLIGGTGAVGRELAPLLAARGATVSILTREPDAAHRVPEAARTRRGEFSDPSSLRAALLAVDRAFLLVSQSVDETRYGLQAVAAARVAVRDVAEVAAAALVEDGHAGETYELDGAELLTGVGVAATYARCLVAPVRYGVDSLDAWAETVSQVLPAWLVRDLRAMHHQFQLHGMPARPRDMVRLRAILGRPPRAFDAFVATTVALWRGEPVANLTAWRRGTGVATPARDRSVARGQRLVRRRWHREPRRGRRHAPARE